MHSLLKMGRFICYVSLPGSISYLYYDPPQRQNCRETCFGYLPTYVNETLWIPSHWHYTPRKLRQNMTMKKLSDSNPGVKHHLKIAPVNPLTKKTGCAGCVKFNQHSGVVFSIEQHGREHWTLVKHQQQKHRQTVLGWQSFFLGEQSNYDYLVRFRC